MTPRRRQDLESTLEEHGSFVRRLARSLVIDPARADDVVQQTWLAAAEHPPADRSTARGWLARVVRNFSFRGHRDDVRRNAREERAARPEIDPAAGATPAGAALLGEVIDAVLALEEPYRSTLLMRFYENLEPSEIAARQNIPAATVRTRLKRALDRLRARFDDAHGGNRALWTAPLLPIALGGLKPAALAAATAAAITTSTTSLTGITLGGLFMAKKIGIVAAIAAIAVVSVVIATRSRPDAPEPASSRIPSIQVADAVDAPAGVSIETKKPDPITARPYVPSADEAVAAMLAPKGAPSATLSGRVVDQNGTPQTDVPVTLRTFETPYENDVILRSEVSNERVLATRTAADGRFSFAQLPMNVHARVQAQPVALCDVTRPASITKPGIEDLGDLVAVPGGSVAGVVLGPNGQPVRNCKLSARTIAGGGEHGLFMINMHPHTQEDARTATTNASGQYRIDGIPEGACEVVAFSEEHPTAARPNVRVRKNEVTWETDFKLATGATLAGVVRDGDGRPVAGATVVMSVLELKLNARDGTAQRPRKATTGADGRFLLQGLTQDAVTVRARKSGFVTASARGVTPGAEVALTLKPCGTAFGYVRNAMTNEPVASFTLKVQDSPLDDAMRARVVTGADAARAAGVPEAPGLFAILGLPDAPVQLAVRAENFADAEIGPVHAVSGEKKEVPILLQPQAAIHGVVVDQGGAPVAGARITVTNARENDPVSTPGHAVRATRRIVRRGATPKAADETDIARSVASGVDGTFVIPSLPGGSFRVTASHEAFAPAAPVDVAVRPSTVVEGIRLVVELGGTLAGAAFDADGNPLAGARVVVSARGRNEADAAKPAITDANGAFQIEGVRPGAWLASLSDAASDVTFQIAFGDEDERPEGTPVTIEPGKTTRVDLRLKARASVSGLVKDGGKPAPGVKVSLTKKGMPEFLSQNAARTDESGAFTIDKVLPGDYTLVVDPPGGAVPVRKPLVLAPRSEQRVTVDLPTGAIEGRVLEKGSKTPLAGVVVSATPEVEGGDSERRVGRAVMVSAISDDDAGDVQTISIGDANETIRTDAEGKYRLRYVPPGKYKVEIRGEGIMPQTRDAITVEEGRTVKDIDFGAEKGATLIVTVDPAGHDVTSVFGFAELEGAQASPDVRTGTVKGGIKFTGLKPGRYRLRVDAPMNDLGGEATIDVASGQEARTTVRLTERE